MSGEEMNLNAVLEKFREEETIKDAKRKEEEINNIISAYKKHYQDLWRARELFGARELFDLDSLRKLSDHELHHQYSVAQSLSYRDKDHGSIIHEELISIQQVRNMSGSKLRPATVEDYKQWLAGYLRCGERPTVSLSSKFPSVYHYYVALTDFEIAPLYGANAINIIVPHDIRFLGGKLGHSNIYLMDGFKHIGDDVPVYSDIKFDKNKELS